MNAQTQATKYGVNLITAMTFSATHLPVQPDHSACRISELPAPAGVIPDAIEIFLIDMALTGNPASDMSVLTSSERLHAAHFARQSDRMRFALTRAALRCLLAPRLGRAATDVPISIDAFGKPCLSSAGHGIVFNVSHSDMYALIALGNMSSISAVGIDIERARPIEDEDIISRLAFTSAERMHVARAASFHHFFDYWTAKEAALKALAVGMREGMQSIQIDILDSGGFKMECSSRDDQVIQGSCLDAPEGYAAAVAWIC